MNGTTHEYIESAAFDTIDHSTLIECLSSWFGVRGVRGSGLVQVVPF